MNRDPALWRARLWRELVGGARRLHASIDSALTRGRCPTSPQGVEVLRLLAVHRCATRSWLAELLGVRPQALHRVLRALAERAWVSSRPSTEDGRARLWLPTEEGLRVLREALELMEAAEEEWLRGLSQGERDALEALIRAEAEARWYGATGGQLKKEAELSSSSA